jgi:hypothetical protein
MTLADVANLVSEAGNSSSILQAPFLVDLQYVVLDNPCEKTHVNFGGGYPA